MKKIILALSVAFLLGGCGSLLPKGAPAPRLYTLNASTSAVSNQGNKKQLPVSLKILKPQAAPGLETERIALRKNNNQIDYFADAHWADDATTMVQASLVESFDRSHRLQSVSNDLVVLKSDYDLLVELHDFQADYKGDKIAGAHVRLTAKLINRATDEIVKTFSYDRLEPVKDQNLNAIVASFDKAQQVIAQKLVVDILRSLSPLDGAQSCLR